MIQTYLNWQGYFVLTMCLSIDILYPYSFSLNIIYPKFFGQLQHTSATSGWLLQDSTNSHVPFAMFFFSNFKKDVKD